MGSEMCIRDRGKTLAAEKMGKVKTVVQLLCISLFLAQLALQTDGIKFLTAEDDFYINAIEFLKLSGQISLIIATFLTVVSGIFYLTKYWKYFLED